MAVEFVKEGELTLAIIVRAEFERDGVTFFSPPELSQQLAYMSHPAGKLIQPHRHNQVSRCVTQTQEVLVLKQGVLRVDFYDDAEHFRTSRELRAGDVILLCAGGHGFEVIENVVMLEVKQGPYTGEADKIRFEPRTSVE